MHANLASLVLLCLYDAMTSLSFIMIIFLSAFSKKVRFQVSQRNFFDLRTQHPHYDALFFCSSAGEYEQALPVASRFLTQNRKVLIVFFSASGLEFARIRNDGIECVLAPIDGYFRWRTCLSRLRIKDVIVVRHEIWPGLVFAARHLRLKLILINASRPNYRWMERILIETFDLIFAVNKDIAQALQTNIKRQVIVAGDTKYDRVMERASKIDLKFNILREIAGGRKIFVIGSAWLDDVRHSFFALESVDRQIFTIVVPHSLAESNLTSIESQIGHFGRQTARWSRLNLTDRPVLDVCIMDTMGSLFELYGYAHLALIGGAFHHRVHNTLEPAVFDVPIACGPNIETSPEALVLQKEGCLRVCADAKAVAEWMNNVMEDRGVVRPKACVTALTGASDVIMSTVERLNN